MQDLLAHPLWTVEFGEALKSMMLLIALSSTRMFALAVIFPPFSEQSLQGTVRNGLCLMIGCFIAWYQPLHVLDGLSATQLLALTLKEALLGLLLGFAASPVFWIAEGVGAFIDNQAGYNNAQQSNPTSGQSSTPLSNLLSQLSQACFWLAGGMPMLLGALFESYRFWPMDRLLPQASQILDRFLQVQLSTFARELLTIAAPMMLVLLLIDLAMGLIGKSAEKLDANNLSQPIKGTVAMVMLSLLVALFFQQAKPQLALRYLAHDLSTWMSQVVPPTR